MIDVSWDDYITSIEELAGRIKNADFDADVILAINRGGLLLGLIFSHQLNLPLHILHLNKPFDLHRHKKMLLVDDISDTGKTFLETLEMLKSVNKNLDINEDVFTVSIHIKPHTNYLPKMYYEEVTEWISYPYEVDIHKQERHKEYSD